MSPDEIDDFQKQHPNSSISVLLDQNVTTTLTSAIDDPDGPDVYDDVPIINKIDFGFYVVPGKHDIPSYIQSVDNGDFGGHAHYDICGYISSSGYEEYPMTILSDPYIYDAISSGYPLSTCEFGITDKPLKPIDEYYDKVDWSCTLAPYVDKIYWRIDGVSPYEYPNNVIWERD